MTLVIAPPSQTVGHLIARGIPIYRFIAAPSDKHRPFVPSRIFRTQHLCELTPFDFARQLPLQYTTQKLCWGPLACVKAVLAKNHRCRDRGTLPAIYRWRLQSEVATDNLWKASALSNDRWYAQTVTGHRQRHVWIEPRGCVVMTGAAMVPSTSTAY
jgi:hypothetical protein